MYYDFNLLSIYLSTYREKLSSRQIIIIESITAKWIMQNNWKVEKNFLTFNASNKTRPTYLFLWFFWKIAWNCLKYVQRKTKLNLKTPKTTIFVQLCDKRTIFKKNMYSTILIDLKICLPKSTDKHYYFINNAHQI